jgi:hypothetical protein
MSHFSSSGKAAERLAMLGDHIASNATAAET